MNKQEQRLNSYYFIFTKKKTRENKVFDAVHYDVYSLFFFIDFDDGLLYINWRCFFFLFGIIVPE